MNKGKIIQIMGPVVDVAFPDELPELRERAEKTLAFRDRLVQRTGLDVVLWDERLTTTAAQRVSVFV